MPRPVRRTQASRRASTRQALLDATIRSLKECGYSKTTTTEIISRAGVSQGALFKHFPTKEALLSAAATNLCAALFPRFRAGMRGHRSGKHPVERALRGLWLVFKSDEVRVLHELYAAAPNEAALRMALAPVLHAHREHVIAEARMLVPELATMPGFEIAIDFVVAAMEGASLTLFTEPGQKRERAFLRGLELMIRRAPAWLAQDRSPQAQGATW